MRPKGFALHDLDVLVQLETCLVEQRWSVRLLNLGLSARDGLNVGQKSFDPRGKAPRDPKDHGGFPQDPSGVGGTLAFGEFGAEELLLLGSLANLVLELGRVLIRMLDPDLCLFARLPYLPLELW